MAGEREQLVQPHIALLIEVGGVRRHNRHNIYMLMNTMVYRADKYMLSVFVMDVNITAHSAPEDGRGCG